MHQVHGLSGWVSQREVSRLEAARDATHGGLELSAVPTKTTVGLGLMVREVMARYAAYESEGSERRSLGSVHIAPDAHWTATLTVPIPPRAIAFLEVERRGDLPADYRGAAESVLLSLPIEEIDALIALLTGVVVQARRDGVLPVE